MLSPTEKAKDFNSDPYASAAHKAGQKLRETIDMVTDETKDAREAAVQQVRDNPVRSSLIAMGVGFVAGLLLRRR